MYTVQTFTWCEISELQWRVSPFRVRRKADVRDRTGDWYCRWRYVYLHAAIQALYSHRVPVFLIPPSLSCTILSSFRVPAGCTERQAPYCLLEMITAAQLVTNYPVFYRFRRFITMFTTVCYQSISWARLHIFTQISLRFVVIRSSNLRLGLPSSIVYSDLLLKFCTLFLSPPHVLHDILISCPLLGTEHKLRSSSLYISFRPSESSYCLQSNIPLSTVFWTSYCRHNHESN